jgi:hypothetical protein
VTAVDFSPAAIAKARVKAGKAGADVNFVVDDLTQLARVEGQFDLLVTTAPSMTSASRTGVPMLIKSRRSQSLERDSCSGASSGSSKVGSGWQPRSCPSATLRFDQAKSSTGLRARLRSRESLASVISQSGHEAGPPTSSLHSQRYRRGTTPLATAREAQLTYQATDPYPCGCGNHQACLGRHPHRQLHSNC